MILSKPPDLMCPIQIVSLELFMVYFRRICPSDRYLHPNFSNNHGIHAVWHWERGVWWTCKFTNVLVGVVVEQLRWMEEKGFY